MARAQTVTLLSLDRFFQLIGMHPLHGNQVMVHDIAQMKTCGQPIVQYSWQMSDRVGREEIAQAIYDAERMLAQWLGYDIAPRWNVDEQHKYSRLGGFQTDMGMVISGGIEAKALIDDLVNITYADNDGDVYLETATVTVSTTVADDEIAIYYPGKGGASEWEIRPTKVVSNVNGTKTITFRREQCVLEDLMENLDVREVDGVVNTNFLTQVDVYRHYNDISKQATLKWFNGYCCSGCVACTTDTQAACLSIHNNKLGLIRAWPATWNGTGYDVASLCCGYPHSVELSYLAGNQINQQHLERAVCYLALTMLDNPICSCSKIEHLSKYWRTDLALSTGAPGRSERYQLSKGQLDNPFGTTRGAIYAWNAIKQIRLIR